MQLQKYIDMDIGFLGKVFSARCKDKVENYSLDEILTLAEQHKDDISEYILYPINSLYDYFVEIGITDEDEMRKLLATFFYFSMKNDHAKKQP